MNRTGLLIALLVGAVGGLIFGIFPQLDLKIAHLFYDIQAKRFAFDVLGKAEYLRRAAMWVAWAFAVPAMISPVIKLIWPAKPLLVRGRTTVFLVSTVLLTAIVLPNLFKETWGRPRPVKTSEFNGPHEFKAWWDPRGAASHNGSFFSGEAATAFWTFAPAALAPAPVRPLAFAAAAVFGFAVGLLRMAFGAHYASDVLAAGVVAFLVIWIAHGIVYRWKTAPAVERSVDRFYETTTDKVRSANLFWPLLAAVSLLTLVRLIALKFSIVDLFPDEARYWGWAQAPAFGYPSKPPFLAWILALACRICGDSEFCLRACAPLFYAGTSLIAYFLARHLYNERAGFWSGLCVALAPGVVFSSRIISTDVALLFLWALALLAYIKLLGAPSWTWSMTLGLALGFGTLSKYAMLYFPVCMVAAAAVDQRARAIFRQPAFWFALLLGLVVITPNVIWNAQHGFITFRHTEANMVGSGFKLDPLRPAGFLATQFAIYGPIAFAVMLLGLLRYRSFGPADRWMLAFAVTPLAMVTAAAFVTSVKTNWAAPAGVSMIVFTAALLVRQNRRFWLRACVVIGLCAQLLFSTADAFADRITVPFLSDGDVYRRTMGWKMMAAFVDQTVRISGAQSIASEDNDVVVSLTYYLRSIPRPIYFWPIRLDRDNQFELERSSATIPEPILYLSRAPVSPLLARYYSNVEELPRLDIVTGPHSMRRIFPFKLSALREEMTSSAGARR